MDLLGNGGFGASPVRTSVASIPAGGFSFFQSSLAGKVLYIASEGAYRGSAAPRSVSQLVDLDLSKPLKMTPAIDPKQGKITPE